MAIKIVQKKGVVLERNIKGDHCLFVLNNSTLKEFPYAKELDRKLKRTHKKMTVLLKEPITLELNDGRFISFIVADKNLSTFQRHTLIRKGTQPLLQENPDMLTIGLFGDDKLKEINARAAVYVSLLNSQALPSRKKEDSKKNIKSIELLGVEVKDQFEHETAVVIGNTLTRELTMLPPNELTPLIYRTKIKSFAKSYGWRHQEFDMTQLKKMGAGSFVAVGQGSEPQDAAIVHLTYKPKTINKTIAVIGKGICFDTGGHNLKPARYMHGMHEDMNGSAVSLGILLTATLLKLPIQIDCWLAIAQNHIGPKAYKQNDVVKSLNGISIEIMHTDAEGRMVLADTLTLASRLKPDMMMDFATLTGSMATALGDRYSGVLSNRPELSCLAVGAGSEAGERITAFPFDADYEEDLDSIIADIKQCTLEGGADHIHAARFLNRFIEKNVPWLHIDLSSSNRKGGLGAALSDVNGFGVSFGIQVLQKILAK
ncbi:MAG: leucyl aminopeptidase family protein [Candidatus Methylopumilus sp.]|nr:leucyl aminopeptidase family protein [Candidatus Methylopumilus sp.]